RISDWKPASFATASQRSMLKPASLAFWVKEKGSTGFVTTRTFCWAKAAPGRQKRERKRVRVAARIPEGISGRPGLCQSLLAREGTEARRLNCVSSFRAKRSVVEEPRDGTSTLGHGVPRLRSG